MLNRQFHLVDDICFSLLFIFILSSPVFAVPIINNLSISPSSGMWLGETAEIRLSCSDETQNITTVYGNLSGPGLIYQNMPFSALDGNYFSLELSPAYHLASPGDYVVSVLCEANSSIAQDLSFSVSSLEGEITGIQPETVYAGDNISVFFELSADGIPVGNTTADGPHFSVFVDNQKQELECDPPGYYNGLGWMLVLGPKSQGSHSLMVITNYSRISVSDTAQIDVGNSVVFSIASIDKTVLKGGEVITIDIEAMAKGIPIDINSSDIRFEIGGTHLSSSSLIRNGDLYRIQVTAPSISPGTYKLRASLEYDGFSYFSEKDVHYSMPVTGKITDGLDKPVYVQMDFFSSGVKNKSLATASDGSYSSEIMPGIYDITIRFPRATLEIDQASLNTFNDPVKYDYMTTNSIPGIGVIAVYVFEVAFPFYTAEIEMEYNEKNVDDEHGLMLFRCNNWNSGKRLCNSLWQIETYDIDTIRNQVIVNTDSLSAFAIGIRQNLSAIVNLEKSVYYYNELAKVSGIIYGNADERIPNATVKMHVKGTSISIQEYSGESGEFSSSFATGLAEGNYTLVIEASKNPYGTFNTTKNFEVLKKREIFISIPSSLRVEQGGNLTQEVEIVNTGQVRINNISFSVSGIPETWFSITPRNKNYLDEGDSMKLALQIIVPEDAEKNTSSIDFIARSNEAEEAKKLGFTVIENGEEIVLEENTAEAPSGFLVNVDLPQMGYDHMFAVVTIFTALPLAFAFRFVRQKKRNEIKSFMSDAKNNLVSDMKEKDEEKNEGV